MLTRSRKQAGDTIVEVLICLAILGSALTVSYGVASRSLAQIRQAHEKGEMLSIAQTEAERLKQIIDTDPNFFDGISPLSNHIFCIVIDPVTNKPTRRDWPAANWPTPGSPGNIRTTNCATDASGDFISSADPNYGTNATAAADAVDTTRPYRAAIVYRPCQNTAAIDSTPANCDHRMDEFYILAGRFTVGGASIQGNSESVLMYRQHPQ